jgi:hypothetical protein
MQAMNTRYPRTAALYANIDYKYVVLHIWLYHIT